jgi:serine/threonine protein phosphatase PrpC
MLGSMTRLQIHASWLTDLGRVRTRNQDTVVACEPADPSVMASSGRLFIVADGAGGVGSARAGKVASRYAASSVSTLYYRQTGGEVGARLRAVMLATNQAIRHHTSRPDRGSRMATTMVAAVVRDARLTLANVGDSRAYLIKGEDIQQITEDHSLVAGLVAEGVISAEEAVDHPQRNVILHSLGGGSAEPRIDLYSLTLEPDDVVLLCTDGLTRYVDDKQLLALLREGGLDQAARRMVDFANACGGVDNISVALLHARASSRPIPRWVWWLLLAVGVALIVISGLVGLALMVGV